MSYTINRMFNDSSFDDIGARTQSALADHGFGILTEIDVKTTMKKMPDVEMPSYSILGACNPKMACSATGIEPRVGAMPPCTIILREVEVSDVDLVASMQAIENADLTAVAGEIRYLLAKTVEAI